MINNIFRSRLFYVTVSIILILALLAIVITKLNSHNNSRRDEAALIIIGSSGGMCPSGACGGDGNAIYNNGDYTNHKKISPEDMNRIRELVNGFDDSNYSVKGDCGSSIIDGSDPYLKFPQKYGDERFEPCGIGTTAQSNPLEEILQILEDY